MCARLILGVAVKWSGVEPAQDSHRRPRPVTVGLHKEAPTMKVHRLQCSCAVWGQEAGCCRQVAALHSDHYRQVPLVGAGCFRQVAALHSDHYSLLPYVTQA